MNKGVAVVPFVEDLLFFFFWQFIMVGAFLTDFLALQFDADFVFVVFCGINNRAFFFFYPVCIACHAVVQGSADFAKLVGIFGQAEFVAVDFVLKALFFVCVFKCDVLVFILPGNICKRIVIKFRKSVF